MGKQVGENAIAQTRGRQPSRSGMPGQGGRVGPWNLVIIFSTPPPSPVKNAPYAFILGLIHLLLDPVFLMYEGKHPPNRNLFIKILIFILTCFHFGHLLSTLCWMQYTHRNAFSIARNSFLTHRF